MVVNILILLVLGLFASSVIGWCRWGIERDRYHLADAKLRAYVKKHQQDTDYAAQHVERLDQIYAALYGYVPTDFDPPTKK